MSDPQSSEGSEAVGRRDLTQFASGIRRGDDLIWLGSGHQKLSYPDEGNVACFQLEDDSFWFRHRNRCIVSLTRMFPPSGVMLDVGGGNGFVTAGLLAAGIDSILIEPGPDGARNARRRGIPDVICATVEEAGFVAGIMPAVGMFDVLEHIEDDLGLLNTLKALMRPGGRIYIAVPAFPALWSAEDTSAGHFRRYTLESLRRVLEAAGFAMEHETYMFQPLWLPVLLLRALPTRLGLYHKTDEDWRHFKRDHTAPKNPLWTALLEREHTAIANGKRVGFGSSCLVVARA